MSSITKHLSETTLAEYSGGTLTEALEVVVACHLTLCPKCRILADYADNLGGFFLEEAEPVAPQLSACKILQKIHSSSNSEKPIERPCSSSSHNSAIRNNSKLDERGAARYGIPKPLARKLPANFDELKWKSLARGIQQVDLKPGGSKKDGAFKLLKLQPGTELLEHTHGDHELTLVLQGSYSDEFGRFGVGDVADLGPDNAHKPVIDSDIPCIALIATDSPARYRGLVGRIIQPFVSI